MVSMSYLSSLQGCLPFIWSFSHRLYQQASLCQCLNLELHHPRCCRALPPRDNRGISIIILDSKGTFFLSCLCKRLFNHSNRFSVRNNRNCLPLIMMFRIWIFLVWFILCKLCTILPQIYPKCWTFEGPICFGLCCRQKENIPVLF